MSLLEVKSKFTITKPGASIRPVTAENFYQWTANHMYRTSYNDMSFKVYSKILNVILGSYTK